MVSSSEYLRVTDSSGLCQIEANVNLIVQLEERLEITYYYTPKQAKDPISNGLVKVPLHHKVCYTSNYIVNAKVMEFVIFMDWDSQPLTNFNGEFVT